MKKTVLASAIVLASTTSIHTFAADDLASFWEESTGNLKVRSIVANLQPNDVAFSAEGYTAAQATAVLFATGANAALGLAPAPLNGLAGADQATVLTNLSASEALLAGMNQFLASAIGENVDAGVETEGTLDQAGSAIWLQFESAYLFDIIGFDLGFQGSMAHYKEDESSKLFISRTDGENDEGYARLSTARLKLRYGSEDVYVKANYGYYSNATETDYLMDEADLGYGASAHYNDFSLSYSATLESSGKTESDFTENDPIEQEAELKYASDFGEVSLTSEFTSDVETTNTFTASSGLPLSMLGLPVSEENMMKYLLLGKVSYGMRSNEVSDVESNQYEATLALKLDGVTLAASYNKASEEGGAGIADLTDSALINSFEMPGQATTSLVARFDGSMIDLDGIAVSAIHLMSTVDQDLQLNSGTTDGFNQFLTGDAEFSETLVDASYSFQEGILEGLALRTVLGQETNQANISGFAFFVDYDYKF
jgi:hypothetical protein